MLGFIEFSSDSMKFQEIGKGAITHSDLEQSPFSMGYTDTRNNTDIEKL